MIHSSSNILYQGHNLHNTYQIDGQVIHPNDSELYQLVKKTTGMTNSGEKKVNQGAANRSVKTGLMKSLLIGAAVLTSIGALATGVYYYVAGRQSSGLSENSHPSRLSVPIMDNITLGGMGSPSSTTVGHTLMAIMNSPRTTETVSSPYSYYEGIYGDTTVRNKHQSSVQAITKEAPVKTTKSSVITKEIIKEPVTAAPISFTSPYMTAKPATMTPHSGTTEKAVTEYKHEHGRSIYYQSIKKDGNYPLGTKFFNKLTGFCFADAKRLIEQADMASPELQYKSLASIIDQIKIIKKDESSLREINSHKEILSEEEYDEEIMMRRKLTTLYLAAETIICKKDFFAFYQEAISDYREYSTQELRQREGKIMVIFEYTMPWVISNASKGINVERLCQ